VLEVGGVDDLARTVSGGPEMTRPPWITPPPDYGPLFAQPAAACTEKAERISVFDTAAAKAAILELLSDGRPRSGEELVDHCLRRGIVPHDQRAFGSVFSRLAQAGAIEAVGFTERKKGHGTAGGRIWRATDGR
jgi:hypothetical protein